MIRKSSKSSVKCVDCGKFCKPKQSLLGEPLCDTCIKKRGYVKVRIDFSDKKD